MSHSSFSNSQTRTYFNLSALMQIRKEDLPEREQLLMSRLGERVAHDFAIEAAWIYNKAFMSLEDPLLHENPHDDQNPPFHRPEDFDNSPNPAALKRYYLRQLLEAGRRKEFEFKYRKCVLVPGAEAGRDAYGTLGEEEQSSYVHIPHECLGPCLVPRNCVHTLLSLFFQTQRGPR